MKTCRICENAEENRLIEVKEMMFGYREEFEYMECMECGCLQISEYPEDVQRYYPDGYYSFNPIQERRLLQRLKRLIRNLRNNGTVFRSSWFLRILCDRFPNPVLAVIRDALQDRELKILDVGCGRGTLLFDLREIGFSNVLGIDPFISEDIQYSNGLGIRRCELSDVETGWDVIMMHHSFEHMQNPRAVLETVRTKLATGGTCIIRIPVPGDAWKTYGQDWVQLDAPRHFYLNTEESMNILARQSGLELRSVVYDSTAFQFWGSEQYKRDISLTDERSYRINPERSIFNSSEIKDFEDRAKMLNAMKQGDCASFFWMPARNILL